MQCPLVDALGGDGEDILTPDLYVMQYGSPRTHGIDDNTVLACETEELQFRSTRGFHSYTLKETGDPGYCLIKWTAHADAYTRRLNAEISLTW